MARVVRFHETGGPEVLKIEHLDVLSPGNEAAGTVAAVGPGGDGFKVGDAVSTIPAFSMSQYGVSGDLVNAPVHAVAHHPASLSWEQAASIWMQYLTGYGALIDIAGLKAGDTLVIPAASSSVGLAAIQIANRVGATAIALTRRSSKRQALTDAGATHVVATDEQDLVKEILGLTGGKGARVVLVRSASAGEPAALQLLPSMLPAVDALLADVQVALGRRN